MVWFTGRLRRFSSGAESFRPHPLGVCCTRSARDTYRRAREWHPPPPPRCACKDPHTDRPGPSLRLLGNLRLLLPAGAISCASGRLTPAPSAVLPPHRSPPPEG